MPQFRILITAAAAAFLAGCGGSDRPAAGGESEPHRSLVLERVITPPDSGAGSLGEITSLAVAETGTIYVMDRKPPAIRVYDGEGRFLRTIGRAGAGPGEFVDRATLHLHHDTLVVHDRGNSRLVLFDTAGRYLATAPAGAGPAYGISRDGLIGIMAYLPDAPALHPPGEGMIRHRLDGTIVDIIHFPVEPLPPMWTLVDGKNDLGASIPLAPGTVLKAAPDGRLVVGSQGEPALFVLTSAYDTVATIRLRSLPAVPIPDHVRRERFDLMVSRAEWLRPIAKIEDVPTLYPVWEEISFDPEGNVWVSRRTGRGPIWDGYRPDGTPLGSVGVPFPGATGLRMAWTGDRIHRAAENDDGFPVIETWVLEASDGGQR